MSLKTVKIVVLTVEEYEAQLTILRTMLQIHQEYAGEITPTDLPIAIRELIKLSHLVEASEQLLAKAIELRISEDAIIIPIDVIKRYT